MNNTLVDNIQNQANQLSPEQFQANFTSLTPLILKEWSQISSDKLKSTNGELELVIELIVNQTEHTRTLIRSQLAELLYLVQKKPNDSFHNSVNIKNSPSVDWEQNLNILEQRIEKLVSQLKQEILPEIGTKARENMGTSLLTAIGLGFILGLIFGGSSRGR